jgi:lipopolysaccharide biosynthesis regulator YciM
MRPASDRAVRRRRTAGNAVAVAAALAAAACGSGRGITPIRTPFDHGVYFHERGDLDAAIAWYRAALLEDERDVRARFNLASALDEAARARRGGDPQAAAALLAEAEREYRRVLDHDRANVRAEVNLAAIEADRGDAVAARARLERAITASPELALPRVALALRQRAGGDTAAAAATLRAALAVAPLDYSANLLLGRTLADQGRVDEARRSLQAARRVDPHARSGLLALAELEAAAGKDGEALALVEQVLLQDDGDLDARLLAAELCERRGLLEAAVHHAWRARDLDRDVPPRLDHAARLRRLYESLLRGP